ncbi:hypothetical protein ACFQAV_07805 [Companilactobacillus huachuanensis]|uniref:Uncharacterized protein n=1 Tax=Companilactobacillus huachuanensis TaxID=2559914 RepID=A0ABW1RNM1_9LACO|nr:hypothetical protein [Companilactobacillus huachuanensis]
MNNREIKELANHLLSLNDIQNAMYNLKVGDQLEEMISIFSQNNLGNNFEKTVIDKAIAYLNQEHNEYIFNIGRGLGSPMLYIALREEKETNKKNHTSKTMLDLEQALNKLGIETDILFHVDPDTLLTDDEFENELNLYKSILKTR